MRRRRRLRNPLGTGARRTRPRRRRARVGRPRVRPRRDRHGATALGREAPASWALQDPDDWLEVLRNAVPAAVAAAGIDPADVVGIATDFTASTPLPVLADGTPLCSLAAVRAKAARLPEAVASPRGAGAGRPDHRARGGAARAVAGQVRRPDLVRVGVREGAPAARGGSRDLRRNRPLDRGRRLDRVAALRRRDPQCVHRRLQGHLPGRRATRPRSTSGRSTRASRASSAQKLEHPLSPLGGRAGGLTAEAAAWTGLPEGIAVAVGNVDAHVTAPAAQAIEPGHMLAVMGTSTCHVMNGDRLAEVPGMCGVVDGGITPGLFGYEAGQSGVGDIFGWFVERRCRPSYHAEAERRGIDVHRHLSELASAQAVGQHGSGRARLAQRQPLGPRRPRAQRCARRHDAEHPPRGHLSRADRGDCVRHPEDRRQLRGVRRAGARAHRRRRAGEEPSGHADLLRRPPPAAARHRVGGRACARLGHARGGGGRPSSEHRDRIGGDGKGASRRVPARPRRTPTPTTSCTSTTRRCTTTSAAAR